MAEKLIEIDNIDIAVSLLGNCDEYIKIIEKECTVTATYRGTQVKLTGDKIAVERADKAIEAMLTLLRAGTPLEEQNVRYCIALAGT
ncbi:MAG: phosphate starvation-inducible protein PhoH, partial [Oscillospiraceae bacterium]